MNNNLNSIIQDDEFVKMKKCGNHYLLCSSSNNYKKDDFAPKNWVNRISKTEYVDLRTGEVKEYNSLDKNFKDYRSLRKSLNQLFELLLCNLSKKQNCVCITLTYQKQMQDFEQMSKDVRNFIERMRRKYGYFRYIYVLEPQTRGSFHYHLVFCFDIKAPYISQDVMNAEWKHGFSRVKSVKSDIQVAKYFVKYNLDLKYDAASQMLPDSIQNYEVYTAVIDIGVEQRVKGIAIELLPPMLNISRHSTGIIKPTIYSGTKGELLSGMNDLSLREKKLLLHKEEDTQAVLNTVKYERYSIVKDNERSKK